MPEPTFRVTVLTEEGTRFQGDAVSVVAPGELGFLGILANHAPLLTTLVPGPITVRLPAALILPVAERRQTGAAQAGTPQQTTERFAVGAGLLEVFRNRVTVVTDQWNPHA